MSLLTHDPVESVLEPASHMTCATFPTQYAGRGVYKSIMWSLTECARQERLQISIEKRPRLLCVLLTVTVWGDEDAVQRFGWFNDAVVRRYFIGAMG